MSNSYLHNRVPLRTFVGLGLHTNVTWSKEYVPWLFFFNETKIKVVLWWELNIICPFTISSSNKAGKKLISSKGSKLPGAE